MNQYQQINRLIKKGLFDERLKTQKDKNKKERKIKIACLIVSLLIFLGLAILFYQLTPGSSIEISSENSAKPQPKKELGLLKSLLPTELFKQDKSPLNILALGRPGQGYAGQDLTDTIIFIHLEPAEESSKGGSASGGKAVLISLPRDLLVKTPGQENLTKINSLYYLAGIEGLQKKVEEITGLSIDHYVVVDLVVAKEIIKLVDGLNVYVPQDINDPFFPGPNHTYQTFNLAAGWRYLDGETALKYIRTRYTSPNGDFDRMARQQQTIQLLKQKVLALNPLWDFLTYLKIFNTLRDHIETDLGLIEIKSLYQIARQTKTDQIISLVIDKKETDLLTSGLIPLGQQSASVVYPKAGQNNYSEIQKYIREFINL